jgi:hypothetical protein
MGNTRGSGSSTGILDISKNRTAEGVPKSTYLALQGEVCCSPEVVARLRGYAWGFNTFKNALKLPREPVIGLLDIKPLRHE